MSYIDPAHVHYQERNEPIYARMMFYSNIQVDVVYFVHLLESSLSLPFDDKKNVIDAVPRLVQEQVDELIKTFLEERTKYQAVLDTEAEAIAKLYDLAQKSWTDLIEYYRLETEKAAKEQVDASKLEEIRKSL